MTDIDPDEPFEHLYDEDGDDDEGTEPESAEAAPGAVTSAGDDEVSALVALRDRLAAAIDNPTTPTKDLSPLTRRYQDVADRLREARALAAEEAKAREAKESSANGAYVFDPESL